MTTQHTRGPWEFTTYAAHLPNAGFPSAVYGWGEDDDETPTLAVADFDDTDPDLDRETSLANARLIAAAPTLLAVAEMAIGTDDAELREAAHAAIRLARGDV